MSRKFKGSRGIMLITVLFLTVFLVMFASAAMVLTLSSQKNTVVFYQNEAALKVAEAGINYAMSRLDKDHYWKGIESGQVSFTVPSAAPNPPLDTTDVVAYEHKISSDVGWVEGRVLLGNNTGYFEIYFDKPASSGNLYTPTSEAGPVAGVSNAINISVNNISLPGQTNAPASIINTADVSADQIVPTNSVFLTCRGKVGNVTRTVQTVIRFAQGDYDAAVIGRGNINIISTDDNKDLIHLMKGDNNKPTKIRSSHGLSLSNTRNRTDYIKLDDKCGGESESAASFTPNPAASIMSEFLVKPNQSYHLPPLKMTDAKEAIPSTIVPDEINAGTYLFIPKINPITRIYENYPRVLYVKYDQNQTIENNSADADFKKVKVLEAMYDSSQLVDVTVSFVSTYGFNPEDKENSKMLWDPITRKLTVNCSLKVKETTALDNSALRGLVFGTRTGDSLSVQIGPDPSQGQEQTPAVMLNDLEGGSIFVDGVLTGVGSIICSDNLDMQAVSKYVASKSSTGLTIYAGGSINVNERYTDTMPYVDQVGKKEDFYDVNAQTSVNNLIFYYKKFRETIKELNPSAPALTGLDDVNSYYIKEKELTLDEYLIIKDCMKKNAAINPASPNAKYLHVDPDITNRDESDRPLYYPYTGAGTDFDHGLHGYLVNGTQTNFKSKGHKGGGPSHGHGHGHGYDDEDGEETEADREWAKKDLYEATAFEGLIFACKNFKVMTPNFSFDMEGMLVAYGGDTEANESSDPLVDNVGNIEISARQSSFKYDSQYLSILDNIGSDEIETLYWVTY